MPKKSSGGRRSRVPAEIEGIQVNFCKKPTCENFAVPARNSKGSNGSFLYRRHGLGRSLPGLRCSACAELFPIKSNLAIQQEFERLSCYLREYVAVCPNDACSNHNSPVQSSPERYQRFGRTAAGSPRYRCKACRKTFADSTGRRPQPNSHKNRQVFALLMNKSPFRRIIEVVGIGHKSLYDKIDFIHEQCCRFAAEREARLPELAFKSLNVSTDRQDYLVNWRQRKDKRNIQLTSIGTADNRSGYVFGMHLNYDPDLDPEAIESEAAAIGDDATPYPFRKHARLWLECDYRDAASTPKPPKRSADLTGRIKERYEAAAKREDVERSEYTGPERRLPQRGMQTHWEYTAYGHFFLMHRLLNGARRIQVNIDQDSALRAAFLAAYHQEVATHRADAFYVRIAKHYTVDQKRQSVRDAEARLAQAYKEYPTLSEQELRIKLIINQFKGMRKIGKWRDRWLHHPFPTMSEPEKAVCWLTNQGAYKKQHAASLFNRASMHGIDRFFMQTRRRLSPLERPIATASASGRIWYGYSPYNPAVIIKLLDIFRVFYNYIQVGQDNKTPAMRIRLAKGRIRYEDILYC